MANLLETSVTCKLYEDLISKCNSRIDANKTGVPGVREFVCKQIRNNSEDDITIDSEALTRTRHQELEDQINRCMDADFVEALRNELERQLKNQKERLHILTNSSISKNSRSAHTYFKTKTTKNNNCTDFITKYYHFDGNNIAREIELDSSGHFVLRNAGKDYADMCQLVLQAATEILGLADENKINEDEFNDLWIKLGGIPYVRPSRLARRHLSIVLSKKL